MPSLFEIVLKTGLRPEEAVLLNGPVAEHLQQYPADSYMLVFGEQERPWSIKVAAVGSWPEGLWMKQGKFRVELLPASDHFRISSWRQIQTEIAQLTFILSDVGPDLHEVVTRVRLIAAYVEEHGLGDINVSTIWQWVPRLSRDKPSFQPPHWVTSSWWGERISREINEESFDFGISLRLSGFGVNPGFARAHEEALLDAYDAGIETLLGFLKVDDPMQCRWLW